REFPIDFHVSTEVSNEPASDRATSPARNAKSPVGLSFQPEHRRWSAATSSPASAAMSVAWGIRRVPFIAVAEGLARNQTHQGIMIRTTRGQIRGNARLTNLEP